jgi:hypothetical protein
MLKNLTYHPSKCPSKPPVDVDRTGRKPSPPNLPYHLESKAATETTALDISSRDKKKVPSKVPLAN